ncbi:MAG TPA: M23 family metallopeptidase [Polyangia bacterium]|jgi:murein DD-endopeptidase MepM/ murein hydrolase activator NlpD
MMPSLKRWLKRGAIAACVCFVLGVVVTHRTAWAMVRYSGSPGTLLVPVVGVKRPALHSSFGEPRSGHRTHAGIDIFARRGTPVVAAAEGMVVRIGTTDRLGGNTVWVAGKPSTLYYYAHLDHFEKALRVGDHVDAGDVLGYVGNTGNARTTPPHLHFGMYPLTRAFWPVDPAPFLK